MRAPVHDLHASNLVSYVSLASGMAAMTLALEGLIPHAGIAIAVSAVADTFDGRFARRFQRTPRQARLGHELDSLVDAIAFGAAPAVVVGAAVHAHPIAVSIAGALYATAVVTRLAHYNLQDEEGRFSGIPSPAAALIGATSLLVPVSGWPALWPLIAGAVLMISPIPLARPRRLGLAAFAAWAIAVAVGLATAALRDCTP
jgi:CDP-diacylglycerol---serine O-phosphatidyltransferase